jgi:hypothetical protein
VLAERRGTWVYCRVNPGVMARMSAVLAGTANREAWLATMMDEELRLQPVQTPDIMRSAGVITIATLIGHLIPLLPFA